MKHHIGRITALIILIVVSSAAGAQADPGTLVQQTTDRVIERIVNHKEELRGDPAKMYRLVSELVFPHFDFPIMSQWALGKEWKGASQETREEFIGQFRKLLVRTYATALLEFSGQKITYPPVEQKSPRIAIVQQDIQQSGADILPIIYRLHNKHGDWKVFDLSVDGVSLVKTYRASFASIMKKKGIDGLIEILTAKNQDLN